METWSNGDKYEGYWLNDIKHGKGKFTMTNGDFYEGLWVDNKKNGFGI